MFEGIPLSVQKEEPKQVSGWVGTQMEAISSQQTAQNPISPARMGLALAAIFSWLLAFPLFGPLLFLTAGPGAPPLGLLFAFAHGAGLLLSAALPSRWVGVRSWMTGAGLTLAAATLTYSLVPEGRAVLIGLMGLVAGYVVVSWCASFRRVANPLPSLILGMTVANLVAATVNLPGMPNLSAVLLGLISLLALIGTLAVPPCRPEAVSGRSDSPSLNGVLRAPWFLPLAAFAVANYVVGGIWYQMLPPIPMERWPLRPILEPLVYGAGVLLFAHRSRRSPPGTLARYSLSLLGLGLLVAAGQWESAAALASHRGLLLLGLAAGDLYFWVQLHRLNQEGNSHRPMGIGLGLSLWLIGLASAAPAVLSAWVTGTDRLFVLAGAGLIFLVIPLVFPEAPRESAREQMEPNPAAPLTPPEGLTQTERQVWDLLVTGATDADIASALTVTRHTAKFHVRNILHKTGAANRKELLSRLLQAGSGSEPSPK